MTSSNLLRKQKRNQILDRRRKTIRESLESSKQETNVETLNKLRILLSEFISKIDKLYENEEEMQIISSPKPKLNEVVAGLKEILVEYLQKESHEVIEIVCTEQRFLESLNKVLVDAQAKHELVQTAIWCIIEVSSQLKPAHLSYVL
jgi:hypothetical protein